ncbi:MAG: TrkA family potassium uptake protein, partial [Candidatus Eremiobacteraeota bacterium]|nr:TrkA family potassium uptake protein [Candidatus Eremiobacteraeota bacterium]
KLAGANRIISPYSIGGKRMAHMALRPTAVEFVDTILEAGNTDLLLEDLTIPSGSRWIGQPLSALCDSSNQSMVLAIKRNDTMLFRPTEDTRLEVGDELIAAGPTEAVMALEARLA